MAIDTTELVQVQNLTDHSVVYTSYTGQRRFFEGQQMMPIPIDELRQLNYTRGGRILLQDYLSVKDKDLAKELGIEDFDNEYSWSLKDVDVVLLSGSTDELEDALEFGPEGIVEAIVSRAVELAIPDHNKREIIKKWTNKDVNAMITNVEAVEKAIENDIDTGVHRIEPGSRRVKRNEVQEEAPKRRGRRTTKSTDEQ